MLMLIDGLLSEEVVRDDAGADCLLVEVVVAEE